MEIFRLFGTISINKAKAIADIKAVEAAGRTSSTRLGSLFAKIGKVAKIAFAAAGVAAAAIFVTAIKKAADFELGMAKVKAIVGATAEEFEDLEAKAKQLGLETAQTMTDIAAGMEAFARAGFNATEIVSAMDGAVALAESQVMDLGEAVAITGSVLRGMQLPASEAERVANALAATASSAAVNVSELGESMKYLAPVAAALGMPLEETLTVIGKLGDAGLKGGRATRALATALENLANPTEEAADALDRLGIDAFDAQGNFIGVIELVGQLETAFIDLGYTAEQRMAAMGAIFAGAAGEMNILIGQGQTALEKYMESITDTTKAFDQQKAMLETVSGQWEILKGSIEFLLVTIGKDMLPILQQLMNERIIPLVNSISEWIDAQGGLIPALGTLKDKIFEAVPALETLSGLIAATFKWLWEHKNEVVTAIAAIGAALLAMKIVMFTQRLWGMVSALAALKVLLTPGGLLLAGVALLGGGLVYARNKITEMADASRQAIEDAKNMDATLADLTASAEDLEKAADILQGAIAYIGSELSRFVDTGEMTIITLSEIQAELDMLRQRVLEVPADQMAEEWRKGVRAILGEYTELIPGIEDVIAKVIEQFGPLPKAAATTGATAGTSLIGEFLAGTRAFPDVVDKQLMGPLDEFGDDLEHEWGPRISEAAQEAGDSIGGNIAAGTEQAGEALSELEQELADLEFVLAASVIGSYEYATALKELGDYHDKVAAAAEYLQGQGIEVHATLLALIAATLQYAAVQVETAEKVETLRGRLGDLETALGKTEHGSYAYAQALQDLQSFHEDLIGAAEYLENQNIEVSQSLKDLIAQTAKYADKQEEVREEVEKSIRTLSDLREEYLELKEVLDTSERGSIEYADALQGIQSQYDSLMNTIDFLIEHEVEVSDAIWDQIRALEEQGVVTRKTAVETERLAKEQAELEDAQQAAKQAAEEHTRAIRQQARELWDLARNVVKKVVDGFRQMREEWLDYWEAVREIEDRYMDDQASAEDRRAERREDAKTDHLRKLEDLERRYYRDLAEASADETEKRLSRIAKVEEDYRQDVYDANLAYKRDLEDLETNYTRALQDAVEDRKDALEDEVDALAKNRTTVLDIVRDAGEMIVGHLTDKLLDNAFDHLVGKFLGLETAGEAAMTSLAGSAATAAGSVTGSFTAIASALWPVVGLLLPLLVGTSDKVADAVASANKWITENVFGQHYGTDWQGYGPDISTHLAGWTGETTLPGVIDYGVVGAQTSTEQTVSSAGEGDINVTIERAYMSTGEEVTTLAREIHDLRKLRWRAEGVRA